MAIVMVMYDGIIWYTMVLWLYFMMVYVQLCILIVVDYISYYYT